MKIIRYQDWAIYANGYLNSIEIMILEIESSERWMESRLTIPLLNLFSHYIELLLKGIISKNEKEFVKNHNLNELYKSALPIIEEEIQKNFSKVNQEDITTLEVLINTIGELHLESNFKYPNFSFNTTDRIIYIDYDEFFKYYKTLEKMNSILNI